MRCSISLASFLSCNPFMLVLMFVHQDCLERICFRFLYIASVCIYSSSNNSGNNSGNGSGNGSGNDSGNGSDDSSNDSGSLWISM